jgi:hypothetical protein
MPRLFTDDFFLFYIQNVGKIGLEFYTNSLSNCARLDVCEYFTECLNESAGIAHYGRSFSLSPRRDLGAIYVRLSAEIALFSEDGANIMIENGWMEQPPQATDRDQ